MYNLGVLFRKTTSETFDFLFENDEIRNFYTALHAH